eukprot:m.765330 g.765330  ORF g.765330 m.765330 type:complete len:190 (-) comp23220_c1_seq30:456-1025(-)
MGKTQSTLSGSQISALEEDTHFSSEEIIQWHKEFIKDCPEGTLSREEFKDIYAQVFPFGNTSVFADHVFDVFDESRSNTISFKEFIKALSVTSRGSLEEKIDWAFRLYDLDKNEAVEYDEMVRVVESIYIMVGGSGGHEASDDSPESKVDKIFSLLGKEHTEAINREDFRGTIRCKDVVHSLSLYDGLV